MFPGRVRPMRASIQPGSIVMLSIIGNNFHILAVAAGVFFAAVVMFVCSEDALHRRRG
jgi:mannitol-specific phosphotransferase system IIBC component